MFKVASEDTRVLGINSIVFKMIVSICNCVSKYRLPYDFNILIILFGDVELFPGLARISAFRSTRGRNGLQKEAES